MSEISISLSSSIGLLGIGFLPHIFHSIQKRSLHTAKSLLAIYIVMLVFYFSGFWEFHSQYYSGYFTGLILVPGSILFFYNQLQKVRAHFLLRGVFIFLIIFPIIGGAVGDIITAQGKQNYREKSTEEFQQYKEIFKGKVLFLDPGEFINRFVVVDWQSYIYSAPYGSYKKTGSRPFTTLPDNINAFPDFFHQVDRLNRADAFLTTPDIWTFSQLDEYKLDYFIISKGNSVLNSGVSNEIIHEFLTKHTTIVGETRRYFIYKK